MMDKKMVIELLETAGEDLSVSVSEYSGNIIVTENDFIGFDNNWNEVERELDNEELVNSIESQLETAALRASGDYYRYYEFDGFTVVWGCASFDI